MRKNVEIIQETAKYIGIALVLILIFSGCKNKDQTPLKTSKNFEDIFEVSKKVTIKEEENNLIFSPSLNVTTVDNLIFFPMPKANKIVWYDFRKKRLESFGQSGQGPLEFLRPVQIAYDPFRKQYEIVDAGNNRIQYLDLGFNHKLTLNIPFDMVKIFPDLTGYWILAPHSQGDENYLLLYLKYGSISHFLRYKKEEFNFFSWVGDFDGENYIAICNAVNPKIFLFNTHTKESKEFIIEGEFPGEKIFSQPPKSGEETEKKIEEFNRNPVQIMNVLLHRKKIILTIGGRKGSDFYLDMYKYNGDLINKNIKAPGLLLTKWEEKLYFVNLLEKYDKPAEIHVIEAEWKGQR